MKTRLALLALVFVAGCREENADLDAGVDAGSDAGSVPTQCSIDGTRFDDGALNPDNACERCSLATSATGWTPLSDGTTCSGSEICQGGVCQAKCVIDGVFVAATEPNPANACEICNPTMATTAWSNRVDGASCGTGLVCESGACAAKCFIDGVFIADGAGNSANACELCTAATATSTWTARVDGTACGTGQVCGAGRCAAQCFIDGGIVADGIASMTNACEVCDSSASVSAFTALNDGASCGAGLICLQNTCAAKCIIDGGTFDADAGNPSNRCEVCAPSSSTSGWSARSTAILLAGGIDPVAQGWTVIQQTPNTLTVGTDDVRLSTSTVAGGRTSGQLLITLANAVPATGPFSLQVTAEVEAVNAHNQLDCGAAILGSFTMPFGNSIDRSQMLCLETSTVTWADDTQSAPANNIDGGAHLYELSVNDAGVAVVTVDGVVKLNRNNFFRNGTIAIGDQTNDADLDGTMRVRSVTRSCP